MCVGRQMVVAARGESSGWVEVAVRVVAERADVYLTLGDNDLRKIENRLCDTPQWGSGGWWATN